MNVADKYMSQVKDNDFKFTPPKFDKNIFINGEMRIRNESLILFNEEGLKYKNDNVKMTSDTLKESNIEFDEETDLNMVRNEEIINNIYSKIACKNPNVLETLFDYDVPADIAKVVAKRLIKLSLKYSEVE